MTCHYFVSHIAELSDFLDTSISLSVISIKNVNLKHSTVQILLINNNNNKSK